MKKDAKSGARAEQLFFDDPAVDGLMGVLMSLATDHYVLRDRVQVLEKLLVSSGQVSRQALDAPDTPEATAAANDDAAAFANELLRPLLGLQETTGIGGRFSLKKHKRRARS
ncbi:MAG: hypothetical protein JSR66_13975 [Proteobacteria bacterium]|nr:hypothetical protein [Pseudomonadota bacterium]